MASPAHVMCRSGFFLSICFYFSSQDPGVFYDES
jgi:hypothetical protein